MPYKLTLRDTTPFVPFSHDTGEAIRPMELGSLDAMRVYLRRFGVTLTRCVAQYSALPVGDVTYQHVPNQAHSSGRKRRMTRDA